MFLVDLENLYRDIAIPRALHAARRFPVLVLRNEEDRGAPAVDIVLDVLCVDDVDEKVPGRFP